MERLEAFEKMLADIQRQYIGVPLLRQGDGGFNLSRLRVS